MTPEPTSTAAREIAEHVEHCWYANHEDLIIPVEIRAELTGLITAALTRSEEEKKIASDALAMVSEDAGELKSKVSTLTARLKEAEEEHGKELRQWQDAVRDKVIDLAGCPDFKIDGAGCDSGEPLEFTLTEISQGFGWVADEIVDPLKQRLKEAEGQIENLLASAVPNAIDHPTMFAAWESARSFLPASTPVEKE